jgi:hypothetical protein
MTGQSYNQFFQELDFNANVMNLVWDANLHYLYLFASNTDQTVGTHLIWDSRNGGLWPQDFPATYGPTAACEWLGNASANDRTILLGCWDGYIRRLDSAALDDDGLPMDANLIFGPVQPIPGASILSGLTIDFGETRPANASTWNVNVSIASGPDAYEVTEGTPHTFAVINCPLERRQKTIRQRMRGGWFTMGVANSTTDNYFSFESALLEFEPSGRNREIR